MNKRTLLLIILTIPVFGQNIIKVTDKYVLIDNCDQFVVGDSLFVSREGNNLGIIEIVKKNDKKAACAIISQNCSFIIGDSIKSICQNYKYVETSTISSASVFSEPRYFTKIIDFIPQNTKVLLKDYKNEVFEIVYGNNKTGYISNMCIASSDEIELFKQKAIINEEHRIKDQQMKEKKIEEELLLKQKLERETYKLQQEAQRLKQEEDRKTKTQKDAEEAKKQAEIRKHELRKKYGQKITNRIINREIWIGMTKDMALDSWGTPRDVNRTITVNLINEQWVYYNAYLYFDNGILTAFQD